MFILIKLNLNEMLVTADYRFTDLLVLAAIRRISKPFATSWTNVRLLAGLESHVCTKMACLRECLATLVTRKRFLICVTAFKCSAMARLSEAFWTRIRLKVEASVAACGKEVHSIGRTFYHTGCKEKVSLSCGFVCELLDALSEWHTTLLIETNNWFLSSMH